jgi:peptide/nickel transport system ATP-binding protein
MPCQKSPMTEQTPILDIRDISVTFSTPDGTVEAVKSISMQVHAGECVAVVGESGSGKSQTFLGVMGLLADNGRITGSALYRGTELIGMKTAELNTIRGDRMSMIFQDPLTSLTPHMKVGQQMKEALGVHKGIRGGEAERHSVDWLSRVRIPEAKRRLGQYPHELSGGMRQRVMIAMSMLCEPDLLIADEPTTALDVTVQAQVLEIMDELKRETGMGMVLITHDMGVVARMADRVQVMRYGEYVEAGAVDQIFQAPKKDYTRMLLNAAPRIDRPEREGGPRLAPAPSPDAEIALAVDDVKVWFPVRMEEGGLFGKTIPLKAVDGVSFELKAGETLGVVGESGCGKSTLARAALELVERTEGVVSWLGKDIDALSRSRLRKARRDFQIVFQDPMASLNPRMSVGASIMEPLTIHARQMNAAQRREKVREMMALCGLDPNLINRYPHELSGGQNQRVGIARAMVLRPRLVVCDEAVSALDVSVQAQILELLTDLQRKLGLAILFISHDLSVVREISHRVMVLYLGRVVELADRDTIYQDPRHPYTQALIAAVPIPDPEQERNRIRVKLDGDLPSPLDPKAQFRFLKSKLPLIEEGKDYRPALIEVMPGHYVAEFDGMDEAAGLSVKMSV